MGSPGSGLDIGISRYGLFAILRVMGFDPTRKHRTSRFDYLFVASALVVVAALVAWAFLG